MKLPKGIELVDGDEATVVGTSSRGGLKGILVRNDSTGIVYGMSTVYVLFWAIAMLVGGIALLGAVVGYAMVPIGLFLLYKAYELMRAHRLMAAGQGAVG